ncbi:MAG: S49 family peptidase [archaeon]
MGRLTNFISKSTDITTKISKTILWTTIAGTAVAAAAIGIPSLYRSSVEVAEEVQKVEEQTVEVDELQTRKLPEESTFSTYYRGSNSFEKDDKTDSLDGRLKVAVIKLEGTVNVCDHNYGICSDTIISLIDAAENDDVDAYIFEIRSGGGSGTASKEMMARIEDIDKPTIALIRGIGASAAYHTACGADVIMAEEGSWVGSIGVRMDHLRYHELIDMLGVEYVGLAAGKDKTSMSQYTELSSEHREMFQEMLDLSHKQFINDVYSARSCENKSPDANCLTYDELLTLATGRVFDTQQGYENGLIDQVGDRNDVREMLVDQLGEKFQVVVYEQESSSSLGMGFNASSFLYDIGRGLGDSLYQSLDNEMPEIEY